MAAMSKDDIVQRIAALRQYHDEVQRTMELGMAHSTRGRSSTELAGDSQLMEAEALRTRFYRSLSMLRAYQLQLSSLQHPERGRSPLPPRHEAVSGVTQRTAPLPLSPATSHTVRQLSAAEVATKIREEAAHVRTVLAAMSERAQRMIADELQLCPAPSPLAAEAAAAAAHHSTHNSSSGYSSSTPASLAHPPIPVLLHPSQAAADVLSLASGGSSALVEAAVRAPLQVLVSPQRPSVTWQGAAITLGSSREHASPDAQRHNPHLVWLKERLRKLHAKDASGGSPAPAAPASKESEAEDKDDRGRRNRRRARGDDEDEDDESAELAFIAAGEGRLVADLPAATRMAAKCLSSSTRSRSRASSAASAVSRGSQPSGAQSMSPQRVAPGPAAHSRASTTGSGVSTAHNTRLNSGGSSLNTTLSASASASHEHHLPVSPLHVAPLPADPVDRLLSLLNNLEADIQSTAARDGQQRSLRGHDDRLGRSSDRGSGGSGSGSGSRSAFTGFNFPSSAPPYSYGTPGLQPRAEVTEMDMLVDTLRDLEPSSDRLVGGGPGRASAAATVTATATATPFTSPYAYGRQPLQQLHNVHHVALLPTYGSKDTALQLTDYRMPGAAAAAVVVSPPPPQRHHKRPITAPTAPPPASHVLHAPSWGGEGTPAAASRQRASKPAVQKAAASGVLRSRR